MINKKQPNKPLVLKNKSTHSLYIRQSISTQELLKIQENSFLAQRAVLNELPNLSRFNYFKKFHNNPFVFLNTKAINKEDFLLYPNKGRKLNETSNNILNSVPLLSKDISITVADGLSAGAVQKHSLKWIHQFSSIIKNETPFTIYPKYFIIKYGRVAIADSIGQTLRSKIAIILIGERPGLRNLNSMSIYLTYKPKIGTPDEKRICISNIQDNGLSIRTAVKETVLKVQKCLSLNSYRIS